MLRRLRGRVLEKADFIVVDVNGLGLEVLCSRRCEELCRVDEEVEMEVVLQLPETGPILFGFADSRERLLFRKLTSVKGIGGKIALSLLRSLTMGEFVGALQRGDTALLSSVPGVGKKTAERLCFELKGKLIGFESVSGGSDALPREVPFPDVVSVVLEALLGLGFGRTEASVALNRASLRLKEGEVTEGLLLQEGLRELRKS